MRNPHDIIVKPIITEKSMADMAEGKYTFMVDKRANKIEIKKAVEEVFDVKVKAINTMNILGKVKRQGMHSGRRASWKKAIIKLTDDSKTIEFLKVWSKSFIEGGKKNGYEKYKPTSPALRKMTVSSFEEITKTKSLKSLTKGTKKSGGRNARGLITSRHIGGGAKRKYRLIDFKRNKDGIPGKVASVEYDPNRTANIALINYVDGEKRDILAPKGLKVGDIIESGEEADIKVGNALKLQNIPVGTTIHNIELQPGKGAQMARSAGTQAQLMAKEGKFAQLKLPSGEFRLIRLECRATIGQVGNIDHENLVIGKAGKSRHKGIRPSVRGSAMNPVDHPHGGGEGKTGIGMPSPLTPWGKPALGYKTRKPKKSDKYIVRRRKK